MEQKEQLIEMFKRGFDNYPSGYFPKGPQMYERFDESTLNWISTSPQGGEALIKYRPTQISESLSVNLVLPDKFKAPVDYDKFSFIATQVCYDQGDFHWTFSNAYHIGSDDKKDKITSIVGRDLIDRIISYGIKRFDITQDLLEFRAKMYNHRLDAKINEFASR